MRPPRLRRQAGLILGALALAGCATAAPKPVTELVWPLPPEQPRIKYLQSYSRRGHFGTEGKDRFLEALLGEDPASKERMVKPYAVTADNRGRVYVTDTGIGVVWVFDAEKKQVRFLGDSGQGRLATPTGVAVDPRGVVFVSDSKLARVFGFDESGKVVLAIGEADELKSPAGLAIDRSSGRLYVADSRLHKVRVYDSASGKFLHEFGERGTEPGKFNYPTNLFFRNGRVYVTDTMNFRVQIFDPDGRHVGKLGEMGANLGQFARPKGVAVDSEGNAYVVDTAFNNFQIFNGGGELLLFVGRVGTQPGEFWLPAGLFIDEQDRILVVDQYNRRVQAFQYLGEKWRMTVKQDGAKK